MRLFSNIYIGIGTAVLVLFGSVSPTIAADLFFAPSAGTIITGCPTYISLAIDTNGESTNGAQVYLDHDGTAGEVTLQSTGGVFDVYRTPDINPTPYQALRGYGGYQIGSAVPFARVRVSSTRVGEAINVSLFTSDEAEYTTKVARDGIDITESVGSGRYTVVDGFCDTILPQVINTIPVANDPNYPVDADISFDVTDNSSGVDIGTLEVTIVHDGETAVYTAASDALSYTEFDTLDYAIRINPESNFTPQRLVTITVRVSDRAGNVRTTSWSFNGLTCEALGCGGAVITQCNDGVDNDGDGFVDLADSGCTDLGDNNEYIIGATNDCTDGIDNDGDGLVDAADPSCRSEAGEGTSSVVVEYVTTTVTTTLPGSSTDTRVPDCRDGRDNDGDALIDYPADDGCDSADDEDEYEPVEGAVFRTEDVLYFLADRSIQIYPTSARIITALAGNPVGVDLSLGETSTPIDDVVLVPSFGSSESMIYDNTTGRYRADLRLPTTAGIVDAYIRVTYTDGTTESLPFRVNVLPYGTVRGYRTEGYVALAEATIVLEQYIDGAYTNVRSITAPIGNYAFIVPNGTYRIRAAADGYVENVSARFAVINHIINTDIILRPQVNLLDPDVSIEDKISYTVATTREQIETVREVFNDPVVEAQTERTVAPIAAAVTTAALLPALSALGFINYLRFLFLQPLLLLGRRKRAKWGRVYDTLTRNPIDLAQVRLVDATNNRVVQSRVTDSHGRYIFFADPGTYRIEVEKGSFVFPSLLLAGEQADGPYLDIYHGEPIRVTEDNTALVANIPLDPVTAHRTPARIAREKMFRKVQSILSTVGIAAGVIAVVISPTMITITLLVVQTAVLGLFYRIAKPKRPKNWGIVYDAHDNTRLPHVVVRLFSKRFDKLVSSDYTDAKGRYAFLVHPNDYYVTYQKTGYEDARTDVSITKDADVVSESVPLTRQTKP